MERKSRKDAADQAAACVSCHELDGPDTVVKGEYAFPPTWGPRSCNWCAGAHETETAAALIKRNVPLGRGGNLCGQDPWGATTFANSHLRLPMRARCN